jgi:transcriptional regulator with XRE-family HTH domain
VISQATRVEAEHLFTRRGMNLEEIAARLEISKGTLARWSFAGKWVEKRQEFLKQSPTGPIETLKNRRLKIIDSLGTSDVKDPSLVDQLWKITRTIESLEARTDAIGPILDAMEKFAQFVARTCDETKAQAISAAVEDFLREERGHAFT